MIYGRIHNIDLDYVGERPACDICGERPARYKDYRYIRYVLTRFLTCQICSKLEDDTFTGIVQANRD